jgi:RNA polymerase sigma factor (sigma-70 family)
MADTNDIALLREYLDRNSETAFAGLVDQHINLVYSVALRFAGNSHDAQDITQAVFVILAKKAASLRPRSNLTGWLYETARLTSRQLLRTRARQQAREQEAYMQSIVNDSETENLWRQLAPLLEDAMSRLSEKERTLVALRFFENRSVAETAAALGIQEWAARKRAERAVEKLRKFFTKRGMVLPGAVLTAAISANPVQAAPVALAKTVTAIAVAKGATASVSTLTLIKGALKIMAWTKTQTAIVTAVVVGLAAFSVVQLQAQKKLRQQNETLQQQIAQMRIENERPAVKPPEPVPHLPAPQFQVAVVSTNPVPEESSPPTNLWTRLMDKPPKLTGEQVEAYLKANGRTASSLLAAFRTSGDPALLKEAMEKFPNDPQVDFEASVGKDLSPDEQRKWLDAFKQSAPGNALPDYLSALNYFNAGQIDQGVQELSAATGKPLDDYTISRDETDREAYLAAGFSVADADALGGSQLLLPQLAQMKQLGLDTIDLANAYGKSGDSASAQSALQMAANLGQGYAVPSAGESEISQLVGIYIERQALQAMDPNSPYGNNGQTVQDQLNELAQQRATVKQLDQQVTPLLPEMSDQDWVIYQNRWLLFGEENAQSWVVNKYGRPGQ